MEQADKNEKIAEAQKELKEILDKYNVTFKPTIDFPAYRELPIEVKLALQVIFKHGAKILVEVVPKE